MRYLNIMISSGEYSAPKMKKREKGGGGGERDNLLFLLHENQLSHMNV